MGRRFAKQRVILLLAQKQGVKGPVVMILLSFPAVQCCLEIGHHHYLYYLF